MASAATWIPPFVAFLKPMGQEEPEASSLWIWLSVVLAPMAPQEIKSAIYWGVMTSKNSVPAGCEFGDATISHQHFNFLVNKKDAKFNDMIKLINFIKKKVFEKYKIKLNLEIVIAD